MIKIYNFPRGARGLRVAWQCEEMGLSYEIEKLTFPTGPEYRKLNPLGSVPFLVDGDAKINESVAIMLYLAQRHGPTPLLPDAKDPAFARVVQMTVFSEATLGAGLNVLMAARFAAPEGDKENWSVRMQRERNEHALAYVEQLLGDRPYLTGDSLTIADIAIVTALNMRQGALGQMPSEKLGAYRDRLVARPAYERARDRAA
ncbi:MAG: glutathione S-transferase family protein [Micropepsaceae bacterium]